MKNAVAVLISAGLLISGSAFASSKPVGKSSLKLTEDNVDSIRTTRKALAAVDKEIAALDAQVVDARSQALVSRSLPAANPMPGASFEALASAIELQKAGLLARRASLQTDLEYQSN